MKKMLLVKTNWQQLNSSNVILLFGSQGLKLILAMVAYHKGKKF